MKRVVHTNYPIQVCSLTTGNSVPRSSDCRRVVTKSRDGKPETGTLRQSERQGKRTGRRKTNDCRHREGKPSEITVRDGVGLVERAFDPRRPQDIRKKLDESTDIAHGVKGGDMSGKSKEATGESHRADEVQRLNRGEKRNAESRGESIMASEAIIVARMMREHKRVYAKDRHLVGVCDEMEVTSDECR